MKALHFLDRDRCERSGACYHEIQQRTRSRLDHADRSPEPCQRLGERPTPERVPAPGHGRGLPKPDPADLPFPGISSGTCGLFDPAVLGDVHKPGIIFTIFPPTVFCPLAVLIRAAWLQDRPLGTGDHLLL